MMSKIDCVRLHQPMDDFFPLWDPIVKKLSAHQRCFLDLLIEQMAIQIISPTPMDVIIDEYREAITLWLERIFVSKVYTPAVKRAKIDYNDIMMTCMYNVNFWTVRLARCIMGAPQHKIVKKIYAERFEYRLSNFEDGKPYLPQEQQEQQDDGTRVVEDDDGEEEGGWRPAKHWVPKPFGMV